MTQQPTQGMEPHKDLGWFEVELDLSQLDTFQKTISQGRRFLAMCSRSTPGPYSDMTILDASSGAAVCRIGFTRPMVRTQLRSLDGNRRKANLTCDWGGGILCLSNLISDPEGAIIVHLREPGPDPESLEYRPALEAAYRSFGCELSASEQRLVVTDWRRGADYVVRLRIIEFKVFELMPTK